MRIKFKIVLWVAFIFIILLTTTIGVYYYMNKPIVIDTIEIGDRNSKQRILIASQGSDFKEAVTTQLTGVLQNNYFIRMIDVSLLDNENSEEWIACVLIHNTVANNYPKPILNFIDRSEKHKIIRLTTIGGRSDNKIPEGLDAITSESLMTEVSSVSKQILKKLNEMAETDAHSGNHKMGTGSAFVKD